MKLAERRKQILKKEKQAKNIHDECAKSLAVLQKQCKHEVVIEADYIPSDVSSSTPPKRMCLVCSLEEEGWGCGYDKLNKDKNVVQKFLERDRTDFYSYRELKPLDVIIPAKLMKTLERW